MLCYSSSSIPATGLDLLGVKRFVREREGVRKGLLDGACHDQILPSGFVGSFILILGVKGCFLSTDDVPSNGPLTTPDINAHVVLG